MAAFSFKTAIANLQTKSGSLINWWLIGFKTPWLFWITPMEFSQVTNCFPLFWRSSSLRPKTGRINASLPVTKWLRFNFVLTWMVRSQFCNASAVKRVSGVALKKFPPIPIKILHAPLCMASIEFTTSRPCSLGGLILKFTSKASNSQSQGFS